MILLDTDVIIDVALDRRPHLNPKPLLAANCGLVRVFRVRDHRSA